jgi:hypothetical protein
MKGGIDRVDEEERDVLRHWLYGIRPIPSVGSPKERVSGKVRLA